MTRRPNSFGDLVLMEASLRRLDAFSSWSTEAMAGLLADSYVSRHAPGEIFVNELNEVPEAFVIISGQATGAYTAGRHEQFAVIPLGPGVLMGLTQTFGNRERASYAFTAQTPVVAIHIPTLLLIALLDAEPSRCKNMTLMLLTQHAAQAQTVRSQAMGSLRQRLASTVVRLTLLFGKATESTGPTRLQLSQKELAAILQANRQAVHRELKQFAADGAISLEYKGLSVLDPQALKDIANKAP